MNGIITQGGIKYYTQGTTSHVWNLTNTVTEIEVCAYYLANGKVFHATQWDKIAYIISYHPVITVSLTDL